MRIPDKRRGNECVLLRRRTGLETGENLKKYGDQTKGSADSREASNVEPNVAILYTFDCSIGKLITCLIYKIARCTAGRIMWS